MPDAQGQNAFDPQRFAAVWAGYDTGNSNDAEAKGKGQELRRMALAEKTRVIDLMGRADVMAALDAQLLPVREKTPDTAALETECAELRAKLAAVVPKATELADELRREKELTARLRGQSPAGAAKQGQPNPLPDASAGGWLASLAGLAALAAAVMMIASAFR